MDGFHFGVYLYQFESGRHLNDVSHMIHEYVWRHIPLCAVCSRMFALVSPASSQNKLISDFEHAIMIFESPNGKGKKIQIVEQTEQGPRRTRKKEAPLQIVIPLLSFCRTNLVFSGCGRWHCCHYCCCGGIVYLFFVSVLPARSRSSNQKWRSLKLIQKYDINVRELKLEYAFVQISRSIA